MLFRTSLALSLAAGIILSSGAAAEVTTAQLNKKIKKLTQRVAELEANEPTLTQRVADLEARQPNLLDFSTCTWNLDAVMENLGPGSHSYEAVCGNNGGTDVMLDAVLFKNSGVGDITINSTDFIGTAGTHNLPNGKLFYFTVETAGTIAVEASKLCCAYPSVAPTS